MAIYRPCPVCRASMEKRAIPEKFKTLIGEIPEWFAYECMNCGTVMLLQPYVLIKAVAKS
jgi:uncharacterized Zn finger protein